MKLSTGQGTVESQKSLLTYICMTTIYIRIVSQNCDFKVINKGGGMRETGEMMGKEEA